MSSSGAGPVRRHRLSRVRLALHKCIASGRAELRGFGRASVGGDRGVPVPIGRPGAVLGRVRAASGCRLTKRCSGPGGHRSSCRSKVRPVPARPLSWSVRPPY